MASKKGVPLLENQRRKLRMQQIAKASKAAGGQKSGVKKPGPKGPTLPKVPSKGTTNTIRATGGNSKYTKINRLSEQTRAITGSRALAPVARGAGAGAAMRGVAGKAGAVGVGANLFMQGKSGSVVDQAVKKLPGIKANPKTDLGKRAGDAISRTASQAAAALKKQLKKAKMGY